eukprot:COSAG02_NODE_2081_length_9898_cov_45.797539_1_plen_504_part_10
MPGCRGVGARVYVMSGGMLTTSAGLGDDGGDGVPYEDPFANNPFQLPTEKEVFQMTKEAKQKKLEERERQRTLGVADKTTKTQVVSQIQLSRGHLTGGKRLGTSAGQPWQSSSSRDRPRERETVSDFIAKKKEMFLLSLSLDTKWAEIQKLEERAQWREEALAKSDKMLLEDSARFEKFLRENDEKALEAAKRAEQETRLKQEKVKEIRKLTAEIESTKNELSKVEENLAKCEEYKRFLDGLTPQDWIIERRTELLEASKQPSDKPVSGELIQPQNWLEDELGGQYFTQPRQLLEIFAHLEENNLFLIQQCQDTEEALEKVKHQFQETKLKMDSELSSLSSQIEHLQAQIEVERTRAKEDLAEPEVKTVKVEGKKKKPTGPREPTPEELKKAIMKTYKAVGEEPDSSMDPISMLTFVEKKLEWALIKLESLPEDLVSRATKQKNKERREETRREKVAEQKAAQERKTQLVLARSTQPVKKRVGKPEMFRSAPPKVKPKKKVVDP